MQAVDREQLWREYGLHQFQVVQCQVIEHRGRFGLDVEVFTPNGKKPAFIDFVLLSEAGEPHVTPENFPQWELSCVLCPWTSCPTANSASRPGRLVSPGTSRVDEVFGRSKVLGHAQAALRGGSQRPTAVFVIEADQRGGRARQVEQFAGGLS